MSDKTSSMNDLATFSKMVQMLTKALEDQDKRSDALLQFAEGKLLEYQTKMESARVNNDAQMVDMEQTRKRRRVEHEIDIKEHGRECAKKLLEEDGFTVVRTEDHDRQMVDLSDLSNRYSTLEADTTRHVKEDLAKEHAMTVERLELTHAAKVAQMTEQNKSLHTQLAEKQKTVDQLREDVRQAQDMVRDVAKSHQPNYISASK